MSEEEREFRWIVIESFPADDVPLLVDDLVGWIEMQVKDVPPEHRSRVCMDILARGYDRLRKKFVGD